MNIQLSPLSLRDEDIQFIFENNYGNVKDYFHDFQKPEDARRWIERVLESKHKEEWIGKREGIPVGSIGIYPQPNIVKRKETHIGLWIAPPYQGQSIGTLLVQALITHIRARGFPKEIFYACDVENTASRRIAEKCGFELRRDIGKVITFGMRL